jgi:plasmid replication initiation protein
LLTKAIEFHDKEGNFIQASFISSAKYFKNKGIIEITVSYLLRPYLINLREKYTTFQLVSSLILSSKFAKRIYMLCSQWKSIGRTRKYSIDELKHMLNLKDPVTNKEMLKNWSQFKEKVLDISVKQINTYTDIHINYRIEKKGRKIEYIIFDVEKTDAAQQIINFDTPGNEIDEIKKKLVNEFKLREDQADKIVKTVEIKKIHSMLYDIKMRKINGEIKSVGAYTAKIFNV